jgi:transglutaminase-like putative cysteine protease
VRTRDAAAWARRYLRGNRPLGEALEALNTAVNEQFAYASGSTNNQTPLATIWQQRKGVCQDFTHIMLSVLRQAGLPSRYVCGYIEAVAPPSAEAGNTLGRAGRTLVGAVATHAWVEVLVPGKEWVALDPTNRQWCGERHITVSRGRDFRDATPLRGTFKGTGKQTMKVKVFVKRRVPAVTAAADAKKS